MRGQKKEPRRVYAKRGEWLVCERGHKIARFAKTVYHGNDQAPTKELERWKQPPPKIGAQSTEIKCTECGADWFADDGQLHFKDGWR